MSKQLSELNVGDLVRFKQRNVGQEMCVIVASYYARKTAVSTVEVSNPPEWEWFNKESHHWEPVCPSRG
jgi:hypothetical protein